MNRITTTLVASFLATLVSALGCGPPICGINPSEYTVRVLDDQGARICDATVVALDVAEPDDSKNIEASLVNDDGGCDYRLVIGAENFTLQVTKDGYANAEQDVARTATADLCTGNVLVEVVLAPE